MESSISSSISSSCEDFIVLSFVIGFGFSEELLFASWLLPIQSVLERDFLAKEGSISWL